MTGGSGFEDSSGRASGADTRAGGMGMADHEGWLRHKNSEGGAVEIWARGWRLEVRVLPLLPLVLGGGFLFSPAPLPIRAVGAAALIAVAIVCERLTRAGIAITPDSLVIVNLRRTHRVPWEEVIGFVGERSEQDGRCVLVRKSGEPIRLSGSLDGEELNPYGEEGDLSAIDELNLTIERFRGHVERAALDEPQASSPGSRRLNAAG